MTGLVDFETIPPKTLVSERAEGDFTDDELARLALAADPDEQPAEDAVPLSEFTASRHGPLPQWYMPAPMARGGSPLRTTVVIIIIASFLVIDALGFCITYGQLVVA